ncbi:hypothetical protein BV401_35600 [Streptomyces malaysiensis subsp. malaysiensis]|uniref:Uncharacterized protein n=1 Tax=Streptomyces autolyticus TaxID=75293 RepID=A0ABN4WD22_9ACTN|nr:hypothetical protein BV401_35600 [Streptomyces autolyticus]
MRPAQFPSVLGDDCPEACTALGLEPYETGYGPPATAERWSEPRVTVARGASLRRRSTMPLCPPSGTAARRAPSGRPF